MQGQVIINGISLEDFKQMLGEHTRQIVREEIRAYNESCDADKMLSAKEVCQLLKITLPTLNSYCKNGHLQKRHIGKRVIFKKSEVLNSLQSLKKYQRA